MAQCALVSVAALRHLRSLVSLDLSKNSLSSLEVRPRGRVAYVVWLLH